MMVELKNNVLFIDGEKYDIPNISFLEEIGSGANAKVFLANNNLLTRLEAIKVWVPRRGQRQVDKKQFSEEVKKNAKASFPNIAKFYDANIVGAFYYARLEYIAGQTLKLFLEQPQELVLRYKIIKTVLESMVMVYNAGFYHGDLHTKNIIIKDNVPYILDFGTSIFSGTASSHVRDCAMLIDLCYEVFPELFKFEFIVKEEMIRQGSLTAATVLLRILSMSWDLENETPNTKDRYSRKGWQLSLENLTEDFSFISIQAVQQFFNKYILQ